jgi:hypothetical protein
MRKRLFLRVVCASLAALLVPYAVAAPTLELRSGQTTVELSPEFLAALNTLRVSPSTTVPGALRTRNNKPSLVFPITNGNIDTGITRLEVIHSGGLTLTAGSTAVNLSQFVIENVSDVQLRIRGLVSANDVIVAELPLFNLSLTESISARPSNLVRSDIALGGSVRIPAVRVALTSEAATALNGAFRVTAFAAGFNIGTATVEAFFDERVNLQ